MGFLRRLLFGKKRRGTRSNPVKPNIPLRHPPQNNLFTQLADLGRPSPYVTMPIPNDSGYILLTNKKDHDEQMLGRHLEFDVNRGFIGRGKTEQVILDGHVVWERQLSWPTKEKLKRVFFDEWDIQQLTRAQVQDILADEDDDPDMYGQTAIMDSMMENELDELREELEAQYVEKFEEDYQRRFKQEYPERFSKDFQEHYNELGQN